MDDQPRPPRSVPLRTLIQPLHAPLRANLGLLLTTIVAGWGKFIIPLAIPALTGRIIDEVLILPPDLAREHLVRDCLLAGGVILATGITTFFRHSLAERLTANLRHLLRTALFHHIQYLSMTFFQKHHAGSLGTRVGGDINQATVVVDRGIIQVVMDVVAFAVTAWLMLRINVPVALGAMVLISVNAWLLAHFSSPLRTRHKAIQERQSRITGRAAEVFSGITVVKAFAGEAVAEAGFRSASEEMRGLETERSRIHGWYASLSYVLTLLTQVAVVCAGAWLVVASTGRADPLLTKGGLVSLLMYLGFVAGSIQRLTDTWIQVQEGFAALERIHEVLAIGPSPADAPDAVSPTLSGAIELREVRFAYRDADWILDGFSFRFQAGRSYALVGPSGCGKSTLARLLLRFYDPQSGAIVLDGHDLRAIRQDHYRRLVSVVLQDPVIFSGTVADNIAFAKPGATRAEIEGAARRAQADVFIRELPEGYDTPLGERGVSLSGGQRQRIAIARSLLRDPRILILDEATSALDTATERSIQEVLDALRGSRTLIVIAHRLTTIRNVDEILVLDQGRLVEHGTWDDLISRNGAFARLVELGEQAGD